MKENRGLFTRILAISGTFLAWIPILAPLLFSLAFYIQTRLFRFDYLMPAELFLFALVGGILLVWAALRARARRWLIGGGLAAVVVFPVVMQAVATTTGLASGEIEPGGWQLALVLAFLIGYCLALVAVSIGGILLLTDLFRAPSSAGDVVG
jgi:hypothetical protein